MKNQNKETEEEMKKLKEDEKEEMNLEHLSDNFLEENESEEEEII